MFDKFAKYLSSCGNFTADQMGLIESLGIKKRLKRREFLLERGEVCRHHTFVCQGTLRSYRIGKGNAEHIISFATNGGWIEDRISLSTGQPAENNIEALEDSYVIQWPCESFELLRSSIEEFHRIVVTVYEQHLKESQWRLAAFVSNSIEDNYLNFMTTHPDLFNRIPLHMVASYLGVSRETLSRVRSGFKGK